MVVEMLLVILEEMLVETIMMVMPMMRQTRGQCQRVYSSRA